MALLAVIWPFAEWDQTNWRPVADTEPLAFEQWMGRSALILYMLLNILAGSESMCILVYLPKPKF